MMILFLLMGIGERKNGEKQQLLLSEEEVLFDQQEDPQFPPDAQDVSCIDPSNESCTPVHLLKPELACVVPPAATTLPCVYTMTMNHSNVENVPEDRM